MFDRRLVLGGLIASGLVTPALADDDDIITPGLVTGPFYPDRLPDDRDPDLLRNGGLQAGGQPMMLEGIIRVVTGPPARPAANALVEIWQCDAGGRYLHSGETFGTKAKDAGFQGYGAAMTDAEGRYCFRTLKPPPYDLPIPGGVIHRAPHIHFAVTIDGIRRLTTQMFFDGEALNDQDEELNRVRDPIQRASLIVPLADGRAVFDMLILA